MRLSVISPFPPEISGIGQYGWHLVSALARSGRFESIRVFGNSSAAPTAQLPSSVSIAHGWRRDRVASVLNLARSARAARPDVIWLNLGFTVFGASRLAGFAGFALPALLRAQGIPVVATLHELYEAVTPASIGARNGPVTSAGARLATRLLLGSALVCVTLRAYEHRLRSRYRAGNIWHIPHGLFAAPEILPRPADAPPNDVLMFTSFAPHRGLGVLLEAFRHVRSAIPDATLTIAGSDHPRFPGYLAAQRAAAGPADGIRWLGPQTEADLRRLFAQARAVVLPYTATTGASSVLHRAVTCGRPVVASDLPDLRLAAGEENLWLNYAAPGDPAALADALQQLLADPARQARQVLHNLAAAQSLTPERVCERYLRAFEHAREAALVRASGWAVNR